MTFVACDNVGDSVGAGVKATTPAQDGPAIGANGRLALGSANLFENTPTATDPESNVPLSALIDEQKLIPDDPQATAPQTQWFPLTPQNGFSLDLQKGFDLGRLDWFNAGGDKSGFDVFYAPPGQYGKWQPLTTMLNEGNFYGQWMSVQLTTTNVQYLQFVPKSGSTDAKLGEIALYTKGATPLVPNKPAAPAGTAAPNGTAVASTSPVAIAFSPIGTPAAGGAPIAAAIPAEDRLAIVKLPRRATAISKPLLMAKPIAIGASQINRTMPSFRWHWTSPYVGSDPLFCVRHRTRPQYDHSIFRRWSELDDPQRGGWYQHRG